MNVKDILAKYENEIDWITILEDGYITFYIDTEYENWKNKRRYLLCQVKFTTYDTEKRRLRLHIKKRGA